MTYLQILDPPPPHKTFVDTKLTMLKRQGNVRVTIVYCQLLLMEWFHINFWLQKKNSSGVLVQNWLLNIEAHFSGQSSVLYRPLLEIARILQNKRFVLQGEHTSFYVLYSDLLSYLLITSLLCKWHHQHPLLCLRTPPVLLAFSSLETPSRLCWAFSSFHHPRPYTSSSACSSGARRTRRRHLQQVFCCFVWNNGVFKDSHLHLLQTSCSLLFTFIIYSKLFLHTLIILIFLKS